MRRPIFSNLLGCAAAAGLCLSQAGCSFTFIETVPDSPETLRYFDCTSTAGLPVADGVFALSNGVTAVTTLTQSKEEYADKNDGANRNVVGGISIAVAAIGVASAIYGIVQTERCRSAKADLRERLLPNAEREQKKLRPELEPPKPEPAGAMPGAPTMVEPMAPESVPPQSAPPAGVPQTPTTGELAPETGAAPQGAPPAATPPAGVPQTQSPVPPAQSPAPVQRQPAR